VPHDIGCLATIIDWDMQQLGVLQIKTRGSQRFRILSSKVEANGLIRAETQPVADDAATGVRAEFAGCLILLKAVLPKLPVELIPEPHDFDNAAWLSNRLSEVLPIPVLAKQKLMELEDPDSRLEIIHKYLGQQGLKSGQK
jgi:Lon protease-like protein